MAFSASSFFGGVATVIATVAIGFGGGVLLTDALVGNSEEKPRRHIERRAAEVRQVQPTVVAPQDVGARAVAASSPEVKPNPTPAPAATHKQAQPEQAFARVSEQNLKKAAAAERRKAQRRAEQRRQRAEQKQLAEQARNERSDRPLFAVSPGPNLFEND